MIEHLIQAKGVNKDSTVLIMTRLPECVCTLFLVPGIFRS